MKRYLLIALLLAGLILFNVSLASANGGPHGGFTPMTDACAGCHRAHTATNPNLLMVNTDALCASCHSSTATGANTNVDDGLYLSSRDDGAGDYDHGAANTSDNAPLLGGGFVNYQGAAVTSAHSIDGTATGAWGNGVNRGVTGALTEGMTCASCHDPHGSPNYRILNETINGVADGAGLPGETAVADSALLRLDNRGVCEVCHQK